MQSNALLLTTSITKNTQKLQIYDNTKSHNRKLAVPVVKKKILKNSKKLNKQLLVRTVVRTLRS